MIINILYRYMREDGGITISPKEPKTEYTTLLRLIADQNKVLTKDGEHFYTAIDQETAEGWYEVEVQNNE